MENLISGMPNIPFPTLGGTQMWQDRVFYAGWRIQKNTLTGHHRLISDKYIRKAWGSFTGCKTSLSKYKKEKNLKNSNTHLVLLVHGMAGWAETFLRLARYLGKKGYLVGGYTYPSLRDTLTDQARALNGFLDNLEDISEITLIGHSQGGMVIRKALERKNPWQERIKVNGMILFGVPNQGAALAQFTKRIRALGKLAPKVRDQLTPAYAKFMGPPQVKTGLIAGSLLFGRGINPLIPGPDDGVVGVNEVWIEGISDRLIVPYDHFSMPNRKKSLEAVERFLEGGKVSG